MDGIVNKIAVIGCGRIAGHHCRAIQNTDGLQLGAVCDLLTEKAENYATEFDVPFYIDYRKMLRENPDISIVVIATPSGMHFEHAKEIISNFSKSVIIEKPTVLKHSDYQTLREFAVEKKCSIFPVFQNRYNLAVQRVKKAIDSGELGHIVQASVRVRWCRPQRYYDLAPWRGTFAMDGGALTNQGIHHVDLLRYLGGEVESLCSVAATMGAQIEVEDTMVASLCFKAGALGSLEVTTAARPHDFEASLSFVCEKGLAQLGGIAVNELQILTTAPEDCSRFSEDFSECVYGNGHKGLYKDVLASLQKKIPFPISGDDCVSTLKLLHCFYVSSELKRWVSPSENLESAFLGRADENLANLYRTK